MTRLPGLADLDEPTLSVLGLGCSRFGSFAAATSSRDLQALVRGAMDLGVTLLDTANIYGQGDSERLIGRALLGARSQAFVVTKSGQSFAAAMRLLRPLKPVARMLLGGRRGAQVVTARRTGVMRADWRPELIAPNLEASLRRLRTDYVDGYLLHGPPPEVIADPAEREELADLKQAGKARHVGVSCDDRASLEAALGVSDFTLLEVPFDLLTHVAGGTLRRPEVRVVAREVLRLQPGEPPAEAVRRATLTPGVASTLIGTGSFAHLSQIVEAVDAAGPTTAASA